jgi:very-short-patch-repair endonuclease
MGFRKPKSIEKSCYIYKAIWSSKNDLLPEMVSISSKNKIWFNCLNCSHEYEQSPAKKTLGSGCPYCANKSRCGGCEICLKKSCFRYKYNWSDKNKQKCEKIALQNNKKFWFNCDICSHEYEQSPLNKTSGRGCPYCSNKLRCGKCQICLKNSCFIYKDEWSCKNKEKCEYVAISSHKKFIFNCLKCSHEYHQKPNSKTSGKGCPYCSNQKRCGDCDICLKNSCFIYKKIWSDKNKEKYEDVAISSHKKFIFNCLKCSHEYEQTPNSKTNNGQGCPHCVNKTELKVADFLKQQSIKFISQFKINRKCYDFYLPDFNLILEIDGDQHFKQVSNWESHEQNMNNDIEKMKTGLAKSMSFLRIYQPDIWGDKIDWKTVILKNLYKRTLPDITYVSSKTDIYDSHNFFFGINV